MSPADLPDICTCNGMREEDIKRAIAAGAQDLDAVFAYLKQDIFCSQCLVDIDSYLFPTTGD
ncbi:MAG: (2Fe-2S)-binding protein [Proteobacteria bacterium]|nr:(2Fe-2S)-binding protein [Pseudomonadota bacterium]